MSQSSLARTNMRGRHLGERGLRLSGSLRLGMSPSSKFCPRAQVEPLVASLLLAVRPGAPSIILMLTKGLICWKGIFSCLRGRHSILAQLGVCSGCRHCRKGFLVFQHARVQRCFPCVQVSARHNVFLSFFLCSYLISNLYH